MNERVFIGVGSNMGDCTFNCIDAVRRAVDDQRMDLIALSSLYLTSPVSSVPQDDYINCAFSVTWAGLPHELLTLLNSIELEMGRTRDIKWGPRVIDLDILLFGDLVMEDASLTIPHPELHHRRFVLLPCLEIDPDLVHPLLMVPLRSFLSGCDDSQHVSPVMDSRRATELLFSPLPRGGQN